MLSEFGQIQSKIKSCTSILLKIGNTGNPAKASFADVLSTNTTGSGKGKVAIMAEAAQVKTLHKTEVNEEQSDQAADFPALIGNANSVMISELLPGSFDETLGMIVENPEPGEIQANEVETAGKETPKSKSHRRIILTADQTATGIAPTAIAPTPVLLDGSADAKKAQSERVEEATVPFSLEGKVSAEYSTMPEAASIPGEIQANEVETAGKETPKSKSLRRIILTTDQAATAIAPAPVLLDDSPGAKKAQSERVEGVTVEFSLEGKASADYSIMPEEASISADQESAGELPERRNSPSVDSTEKKAGLIGRSSESGKVETKYVRVTSAAINGEQAGKEKSAAVRNREGNVTNADAAQMPDAPGNASRSSHQKGEMAQAPDSSSTFAVLADQAENAQIPLSNQEETADLDPAKVPPAKVLAGENSTLKTVTFSTARQGFNVNLKKVEDQAGVIPAATVDATEPAMLPVNENPEPINAVEQKVVIEKNTYRKMASDAGTPFNELKIILRSKDNSDKPDRTEESGIVEKKANPNSGLNPAGKSSILKSDDGSLAVSNFAEVRDVADLASRKVEAHAAISMNLPIDAAPASFESARDQQSEQLKKVTVSPAGSEKETISHPKGEASFNSIVAKSTTGVESSKGDESSNSATNMIRLNKSATTVDAKTIIKQTTASTVEESNSARSNFALSSKIAQEAESLPATGSNSQPDEERQLRFVAPTASDADIKTKSPVLDMARIAGRFEKLDAALPIDESSSPRQTVPSAGAIMSASAQASGRSSDPPAKSILPVTQDAVLARNEAQILSVLSESASGAETKISDSANDNAGIPGRFEKSLAAAAPEKSTGNLPGTLFITSDDSKASQGLKNSAESIFDIRGGYTKKHEFSVIEAQNVENGKTVKSEFSFEDTARSAEHNAQPNAEVTTDTATIKEAISTFPPNRNIVLRLKAGGSNGFISQSRQLEGEETGGAKKQEPSGTIFRSSFSMSGLKTDADTNVTQSAVAKAQPTTENATKTAALKDNEAVLLSREKSIKGIERQSFVSQNAMVSEMGETKIRQNSQDVSGKEGTAQQKVSAVVSAANGMEQPVRSDEALKIGRLISSRPGLSSGFEEGLEQTAPNSQPDQSQKSVTLSESNGKLGSVQQYPAEMTVIPEKNQVLPAVDLRRAGSTGIAASGAQKETKSEILEQKVAEGKKSIETENGSMVAGKATLQQHGDDSSAKEQPSPFNLDLLKSAIEGKDGSIKTNAADNQFMLSYPMTNRPYQALNNMAIQSSQAKLNPGELFLISSWIADSAKQMANEENNLIVRVETEELGAIRIHMQQRDDGTDVAIRVQSERSRSILENSLSDLKQQLNKAETPISELRVLVDDRSQQQYASQQNLLGRRLRDERRKRQEEMISVEEGKGVQSSAKIERSWSTYEVVA
jgi:hypothetical protein